MKKSIFCLFTTLVLSSCGTIKFVQYEQPGEHKSTNHWHHTTLNGMVELSRALDVSKICGDKAWTTITTERTFYNFLADALVPNPYRYVSLYVPWTNKVECFEDPENNTDGSSNMND